MQDPIGLLKSLVPLQKYNTIEIYQDSQVLFGLNANGGIEIQQDQIRFMLAIIEHKFNSFIIQSFSDQCYYRWNKIEKDDEIIMDENQNVQFKNQEQVWWQYQLVFVEQSKSKNQDSKSKRMIQADNHFLENTLKCSICLEILQQPVQIQCNHCFCGYCITQLVKTQSRCPTCRSDIRQITSINALANLTQLYLLKHPSKAKSIEQQELYECDDRYYDEGEVSYPHQLPNYIQRDIQDQLQPSRCRSCEHQYQQYVCQPNQQHVQCCNYLIPIRHLNTRENQQYKMFCQICKRYTCRYYYNNQCTNKILDLITWSQVMSNQNHYFMPQQFLLKIEQYLKGLPIDYMFSQVIQNFVKKEQFYFDGQQRWSITNENELLLSGSPLCFECMQEVAPQMVIKFFEHNVLDIEMPNCVNGIYCQQLFEDEDHDTNYNHFCRRQV